MRKRFVCLLLSVVLVLLATSAFACTSFAVYSENTIYGMNFDFDKVNIWLRIDQPEGCYKVVSMFFDGAYGQTGNNALMNEKGLFSAVQNKYPTEPYSFVYEEGTEQMAGFGMWTPYLFDSVEGIRQAAGEQPMRMMFNSFHDLFADMSGDATVLELIGGELSTTDIQGKFIVMSNFASSLFADAPYTAVTGFGSDRYIKVYEYITEHFADFDVDDAFVALESAMQYSTRFSMVHDPANRLSYFAIGGDFSMIWKVSMDDETVETYRGFNTPACFPVTEEGVNLQALVDYAIKDRR